MKSLLIGAQWEVPWEMVVLMGMSQTGYVSQKFYPAQVEKSQHPAPQAPQK